jgi:hypothetical protein
MKLRTPMSLLLLCELCDKESERRLQWRRLLRKLASMNRRDRAQHRPNQGAAPAQRHPYDELRAEDDRCIPVPPRPWCPPSSTRREEISLFANSGNRLSSARQQHIIVALWQRNDRPRHRCTSSGRSRSRRTVSTTLLAICLVHHATLPPSKPPPQRRRPITWRLRACRCARV